MLQIENLTIQIDKQVILEDFSLSLEKPGIYGLTGPNGSGKSSLAKAIMGLGQWQISGQILLTTNLKIDNLNSNFLSDFQVKQQVWDLTSLSIWQRARLGLFLAFQNPPLVKGVSTLNLLKAALENSISDDSFLESQPTTQKNSENLVNSTDNNRIQSGLKNLPGKLNNYNQVQIDKRTKKTSSEILNLVKNKAVKLQIGNLYKQKLENLSGGERKKLEILQLLCLEPRLAILDEVDSGLDQASVQLAAQVLIDYIHNHPRSQILVISHNPYFLELLQPIQVFNLAKPNNHA